MSPRNKQFLTHRLGVDKKIVCQLGTNISHTQQGGTNIFYKLGGANIFLIIMIIVENVSGASIMSSEARKPPAGARILGP